MEIHPDPDLASLRAESITSSSAPFIRPFSLDDGVAKNIAKLEKKLTQLKYQFYMAIVILLIGAAFMGYHTFNNSSNIGKMEEDKSAASPVKQGHYSTVDMKYEHLKEDVEKIRIQCERRVGEALNNMPKAVVTKEQFNEIGQHVEAIIALQEKLKQEVDSLKKEPEENEELGQRVARLEAWRSRNEILAQQIEDNDPDVDQEERDMGDDGTHRRMLQALTVQVGAVQNELGSLAESINASKKGYVY